MIRSRRSSQQSTAFTLIELMLSIALVLILLLGVNYVFRTTTDAINAGTTANKFSSNLQSAQPQIFDDFQSISKNPPFFIISSTIVPQFLSSSDAQTGGDPTQVNLDNGATAPQQLPLAIYNYRMHRADMVKFFTHGIYSRRTAPDPSFTDALTSYDAYVQLGHAALPRYDLSSYYGPVTDTPNNASDALQRVGAYASDWALARSVTLLVDPTVIAASTAPNEVWYPRQAAPVVPPGQTTFKYTANMTPIGTDSIDNSSGVSPYPPITVFQSSRYDMAGATPEQISQYAADEIVQWQNDNWSGGHLWWNPLVYNVGMLQAAFTPIYPLVVTGNVPNTPPVEYYQVQSSQLANLITPQGTVPLDIYARPQSNPLLNTPLTPANFAQMSPYFLQHCSQFIVEYAGDYMQQNTNGDMTGIGPDGQIDFYLDANNNKHIRWYGMPRSGNGGVAHALTHSGALTGPVVIRGYDPGNPTDQAVGGVTTGGLLNDFTDVIPLRDYYSLYVGNGTTTVTAPPWEVDVNFPFPTTTQGDYGAVGGMPAVVPGSTPAQPPRYTCAWYKDMPAMIRILIKVDDPNDKVKDGPWYEFVFKLK